MHAVFMNAPGAPEVLQYRPGAIPVIAHATEVKIALHAAGINPIDTKVRARGLFFPSTGPAILGCDGAGEVVEVGKKVSRFKPGDAVYFCHGGLGREPGNYAEYTVIDETLLSHKPAALGYVHSAALPLVVITAWEAFHQRARIQAGQTVLVHAGAGGVGHIAIQLAKLAGCRVLTTVSDANKAAFVRGLGADEVIEYTQNNFVEQVLALTQGKGADMVFDTVGGETFRQSIAAVAHYGDLVTLLDPGNGVDWKEARTRNLRIGFELMLTPMMRDLPLDRQRHVRILEECAQLVDAGKLHVHVSHVLPLEQAAEAHRLIEAGHTQGKIVLSVQR